MKTAGGKQSLYRGIWAGMLTLLGSAVLVFFSDMTMLRAEAKTIYTQKDSQKVGNGSMTNPYGDISYAINAAVDGDTIVLLGSGYANDLKSDASPLVIDKAVTIQGSPQAGEDITDYALDVRAGGIVLSADVTFKNMAFNLTNSVNPGIYANGHTLTLDNTTQITGTKTVNLYGGGLYYKNQTWGTEGDNAQIKVTGTSTKLGDIYAGGKECDYSYNVTITLNGRFSSVGTVYGCGQSSDTVEYITEGDVTINLNDSNVRLVDGLQDSFNLTKAAVVFSATAQKTTGLSNVASVIINSGELVPQTLDENVAVLIQSEGILNLGTVAGTSKTCTIAYLQGNGGTLRLGAEDRLTINGPSIGNTNVILINTNGYPTPAEEEHVYIDASADTSGGGTFTLIPYANQPNMELKNTNGLWKASESAEDKKELLEDNVTVGFVGNNSIFDGTQKEINVTVTDQNSTDTLAVKRDYLVYFYRGDTITSDFTSPGAIEIEVTGMGRYSGTVSKTITIEKAELTVNQPKIISCVYTKTGEYTVEPEVRLPKDTGEAAYSLEGASFTNDLSILAETPTVDAKTGTVTYRLKGQDGYRSNQSVVIPVRLTMDNYEDVVLNYTIELTDKTEQAELKINKRDSIAYGKSFTVIATGGSGTGEITYSVSPVTGEAHLEAGNKVVADRVGTITVTAVKAGDTEYKEAGIQFTLEIIKSAPPITPTYECVKEKGMTLNEVNLSYTGGVEGTIKWVKNDHSDQETDTEVLQNVTYIWLFTPTDQDNYTTAAGTIILWEYDSAKWQENLSDYFRKQQLGRQEERINHNYRWREQNTSNAIQW